MCKYPCAKHYTGADCGEKECSFCSREFFRIPTRSDKHQTRNHIKQNDNRDQNTYKRLESSGDKCVDIVDRFTVGTKWVAKSPRRTIGVVGVVRIIRVIGVVRIVRIVGIVWVIGVVRIIRITTD